jgi:hypothetical protein
MGERAQDPLQTLRERQAGGPVPKLRGFVSVFAAETLEHVTHAVQFVHARVPAYNHMLPLGMRKKQIASVTAKISLKRWASS